MDFTREPIIETVVTPKEGCKLVVRSSKSTGQEEYFVDAVEVVSFGHSFFFRSLERPKAFLVPVSDYEILEVREARMVLKNVGIERAIKIGGGREAQTRTPREPVQEKVEHASATVSSMKAESAVEGADDASTEPKPAEARLDKKRDRRRNYRRRRGRDETGSEGEGGEDLETSGVKSVIELSEPSGSEEQDFSLSQPITTTSILSSLLPPPPTLISETIARYKDNALFKGAFYSKEEPKVLGDEGSKVVVPLQPPEYGSFEVSEEEEERIYQMRKLQAEADEVANEEEGRPIDDVLSSELLSEPLLPSEQSAESPPPLEVSADSLPSLEIEDPSSVLEEASPSNEESESHSVGIQENESSNSPTDHQESPQEGEVSNGNHQQ